MQRDLSNPKSVADFLRGLALVQQRAFHDTQNMGTNVGINLKYFVDIKDPAKTNLEVAGQINNNGTFAVYVMQAQFYILGGVVPTVADLQNINEIIKTGRYQFIGNQVQNARFPLSKLLQPAFIAGGVSLDGSTGLEKTVSGKYVYNIPIPVGLGNSFQFDFQAQAVTDPSRIDLRFDMDGVLITRQQAEKLVGR